MPGVVKLVRNNEEQSVSAVHRYKDAKQLRKIINSWNEELTRTKNRCFVHVMPDLVNLKNYNFYEVTKTK